MKKQPIPIIRYCLMILLIQLAVAPSAWSQSVKLSGVVKDDKGNPMKGATVAVKGLSRDTLWPVPQSEIDIAKAYGNTGYHQTPGWN